MLNQHNRSYPHLFTIFHLLFFLTRYTIISSITLKSAIEPLPQAVPLRQFPCVTSDIVIK